MNPWGWLIGPWGGKGAWGQHGVVWVGGGKSALIRPVRCLSKALSSSGPFQCYWSTPSPTPPSYWFSHGLTFSRAVRVLFLQVRTQILRIIVLGFVSVCEHSCRRCLPNAPLLVPKHWSWEIEKQGVSCGWKWVCGVIVMTVECSSSWCDVFIDFNRLLLTYTLQVKNKSLEMNCLSPSVSILNKTEKIMSSFFQCSKQIQTTMINFFLRERIVAIAIYKATPIISKAQTISRSSTTFWL